MHIIWYYSLDRNSATGARMSPGEWVGVDVCALASVYTPLHYTLLRDVEFTAKTRRRRLTIRIILLQYALGNPVHKSRLWNRTAQIRYKRWCWRVGNNIAVFKYIVVLYVYHDVIWIVSYATRGNHLSASDASKPPRYTEISNQN